MQTQIFTPEIAAPVFPEIEVKVKFSLKCRKSDLFQITCARDAFALSGLMFDDGLIDWKEEMFMICLNRANRALGYYRVSSGGVGGTLADPKVIFTTALNVAASSIILLHNHPSGNLKPSQADLHITRKIKEGAELLDMSLLDHLIVADGTFYSLAEEGHL